MSEPTCAPELQGLLQPIDSVTRYPGNPKRHDLDTIKESISRFGFWRAIVVQESTGHVLAGNGQHEAAQQLGATVVPVVRVDVDDDDAKRIVLMDNRSGEKGGGYDDELLAELLKDVQSTEGGLDGSGFADDDVDALLAKMTRDALGDDEGDFEGGDADEGDYNPFWGVVVTADDEDHQAELLDRFAGQGLTVKAVMS